MKQLKLSRELAFPLEIVTETIAILAKRGAGKSYTASVLVEEMLEARLQVVVVDPMGTWYGLRSPNEESSRPTSYPIAILGGEHGDVPLEPTGGQLVADLVVDERLSAVLDLSQFSKNEWRRFVADFVAKLYQRNREAMHVVLEEADLFAPEGKLKRAGDEQMLGAVYDLVRRGRGRGIGSTLITQRSASISKEVLTQAEILIALRTTGPHDRRAIETWVEVHGMQEERDRVVSSLASLPTGTAWVWWPVAEILRHVAIRDRRTFDSSATPKPGEAKREPKTVADVDLDALAQRMASTIEKAKAEDPRELRRQVAELQRELARAKSQPEVETRMETVVERVEVPVFNGQLEPLTAALADLRSFVEPVLELGDTLRAGADAIAGALDRWSEQKDPRVARAQPARVAAGGPRGQRRDAAPSRGRPAKARETAEGPGVASRSGVAPPPSAASTLTGPQQRVLDALAWLEDVGFPQPTKIQTGFIAGYRVSKRVGGTFGNILGELRSAGLLDYPSAGLVELTETGRAVAAIPDIEPTTRGLQEAVYARLDGPEGRVLEVLVANYPAALTKRDVGELAGYTVGDRVGGTYGNILGRLRSLGLIDYPSPGEVIALPVLFLEGALA